MSINRNLDSEGFEEYPSGLLSDVQIKRLKHLEKTQPELNALLQLTDAEKMELSVGQYMPPPPDIKQAIDKGVSALTRTGAEAEFAADRKRIPIEDALGRMKVSRIWICRIIGILVALTLLVLFVFYQYTASNR